VNSTDSVNATASIGVGGHGPTAILTTDAKELARGVLCWLEAHGRVVLENINGDVHITAWDRNEVKVDAAKSAWSQERLDDARIVVDAHHGVISIKTRYPGQGDSEHPATVDYTVKPKLVASLEGQQGDAAASREIVANERNFFELPHCSDAEGAIISSPPNHVGCAKARSPTDEYEGLKGRRRC
jgi:hypothetical protein